MRYQMTARTDRSELGRYSPAYATGAKRFVTRNMGVWCEGWGVIGMRGVGA